MRIISDEFFEYLDSNIEVHGVSFKDIPKVDDDSYFCFSGTYEIENHSYVETAEVLKSIGLEIAIDLNNKILERKSKVTFYALPTNYPFFTEYYFNSQGFYIRKTTGVVAGVYGRIIDTHAIIEFILT